MPIDWNEEEKAWQPLHEVEAEILQSLKDMAKQNGAPKGVLPYMLRHMHRALEQEFREEAKENGFEELGHYFAYCALMGLAPPVMMEDE